MSSAFDFQMYIGPNTQIPQPTDFQARKIMQWDTDGQENDIKLDRSRPASDFNDLLELRKMIILMHLPCRSAKIYNERFLVSGGGVVDIGLHQRFRH